MTIHKTLIYFQKRNEVQRYQHNLCDFTTVSEKIPTVVFV
jgi:hypothetical protein